MAHGDTREHESYGMISFTRFQSGTKMPFVGASLKHDRGIFIEIKTARENRDLSRTTYFESDTVVRVRITEAQLGEMLSKFNAGGTPCTIEYSPNGPAVKREETPFRPIGDEFSAEFRETAREATKGLTDAVHDLAELLKGAPRKGDLREVLAKLQRAEQDLRSNLPFVEDQFRAQLERTVREAEATISAHADAIATARGLSGPDELVRPLIEDQTAE